MIEFWEREEEESWRQIPMPHSVHVASTYLVGKGVRNVIESSEDEENPSLPIGEGLDELLPLPELVLDSGVVGSDSLDGTE